MQITGKTLLNQAESILKDRKHDQGVRTGKSDSTAGKPVSADSVSAGVIETRLLNLQKDLGETQKNLSREQMRYSFLTENPDEITEKLMYDGNILFPESIGPFHKEKLAETVQNDMNQLVSALKKMQVEMENLYALKFDSSEQIQIKASDLTGSDALKQLDPERVAKLTR